MTMIMLACQKIEVLHYTDLGLEVGLLLGSDYGQGLLPEPSNISEILVYHYLC